jgi:hypothetical protein
MKSSLVTMTKSSTSTTKTTRNIVPKLRRNDAVRTAAITGQHHSSSCRALTAAAAMILSDSSNVDNSNSEGNDARRFVEEQQFVPRSRRRRSHAAPWSSSSSRLRPTLLPPFAKRRRKRMHTSAGYGYVQHERQQSDEKRVCSCYWIQPRRPSPDEDAAELAAPQGRSTMRSKPRNGIAASVKVFRNRFQGLVAPEVVQEKLQLPLVLVMGSTTFTKKLHL